MGLILVSLVAIGFFWVSNEIAADDNAKAVFEKLCSLCHSTSRSLDTNKSGDEWRQSVMRMKTYAGDRISDEEAEIIIDYLTEIRGK
jgi:hypothetical protein